MAHLFNTESHLICNLCTSITDALREGDTYSIQQTFDMFPALEQKFHQSHMFTIDSMHSKTLCQDMGLCKSTDPLTLMTQDKPHDLQTHIDFVNAMETTWKAGVNKKFEGASLYEIKQLLGTVVDTDWVVKTPTKTYEDSYMTSLPESFDPFTKWPECASVLGHVRDQSNSGLCWAHGTTQAFNERLCIASKGQFTESLSISDTAGCCAVLNCFSFGVNGGQVSTPWRWFNNVGVVSGGDYGDNKLCYDFTMPHCNHHSDKSTLPSCDQVTQVAPQCVNTCQTNTTIDYKSDKNKAKSHYHLVGVDAIKQDILMYGSVTGAFTVYEDFLSYQSGVYQHVSGEALGGHAIVIQSFGIENGTEYWLCKNSWNSEWGNQGTFKIKIGDSGINDQVYAGLV